MNEPGSLTPQWVLVGMVLPGGRYRIYACAKPQAAKFDLGDYKRTGPVHYTLTAELPDMLLVDAATPRACMERVAELWENRE